MMTLEEVRKRIRACEEELYRLYKARVIGIFGSYARGTPREDSDVDILVEFESGASLFDLGGAQAMLSEVLDIPVDVVPREDLRPELRARIEREVVPLSEVIPSVMPQIAQIIEQLQSEGQEKPVEG